VSKGHHSHDAWRKAQQAARNDRGIVHRDPNRDDVRLAASALQHRIRARGACDSPRTTTAGTDANADPDAKHEHIAAYTGCG
jgi:hypothetical protein